jgi:hypothetical protein
MPPWRPGPEGLESGAKPVFGEDFRKRVLALWEEGPPAGQACLDDVEIWFGTLGLDFRTAACMMPAMLRKRVPQPPVDPARRDLERHDFWPGFIAALIGVVLLFCGARHLTGVDTVGGSTASEAQLTKAFSAGGLQYADQLPPAPPPKFEDSASSAEALDRWARQTANPAPLSWKVRVDTGAKKACPT